jgi:hypothetical protein
MAEIRLTDVKKSYHKLQVIHGVTWTSPTASSS